jgi:hypothetical protein
MGAVLQIYLIFYLIEIGHSLNVNHFYFYIDKNHSTLFQIHIVL